MCKGSYLRHFDIFNFFYGVFFSSTLRYGGVFPRQKKSPKPHGPFKRGELGDSTWGQGRKGWFFSTSQWSKQISLEKKMSSTSEKSQFLNLKKPPFLKPQKMWLSVKCWCVCVCVFFQRTCSEPKTWQSEPFGSWLGFVSGAHAPRVDVNFHLLGRIVDSMVGV